MPAQAASASGNDEVKFIRHSPPVLHYFHVSWFYRRGIRPILFRQDAERAHNDALKFLSSASRSQFLCGLLDKMYGAPELPVEVFGLKFPNPIGLAAGMDKHAAAVPVWEKLGFGFSELGGVTWHAQPGNPAAPNVSRGR
ncbi:MAG: hypothetical protein WDM80_04270 [Limisphaerales bacterium]